MPLHVHCSNLLEDRALSQYGSYTWKMVLKRLFISDIWDGSAHLLFEVSWKTGLRVHIKDGLERVIHHLHWGGLCSVHSLFRSSGRQSFHVGDTGEACACFCSGVLGDRILSQYDSFMQKMVLERPFIGDTGEDYSAHSLLRFPGTRS